MTLEQAIEFFKAQGVEPKFIRFDHSFAVYFKQESPQQKVTFKVQNDSKRKGFLCGEIRYNGSYPAIWEQ